MLRTIAQAGCFALLLLCAVGCKSMFGSRGLPPDPLFANKKPVETQAIAGPPTAWPHVEPAPPVNPYVAER